MSLLSPWLLASLLLVPVAIGVWLLAERRRRRYAVRYPNVDDLAAVVPRRSWPRLVPPLIFLLGLTALLVALARPQRLMIPCGGTTPPPPPPSSTPTRVNFAPGTTSASMGGTINQGAPASYILWASAGQTLTVQTVSRGDALVISISCRCKHEKDRDRLEA